MLFNPQQIKHLYCIGIGGIGVSALAKWFHAHGIKVSGSDRVASEIIDEIKALEMSAVISEDAKNIPEDADCVIYSSPAVGVGNKELDEVRRRGIPSYTYPQMLGMLSKDHETIAVSGTNGKSTTTAMLGLIFEAAGLDPTVIVGSKVKTFQYGNARIGKSKYWIVEACEHYANFLRVAPHHAVVTNLEPDHLDFYRDIQHIQETFAQFLKQISVNGTIVLNSDNAHSKILAEQFSHISFGLTAPSNYSADAMHIEHDNTTPKNVFTVLERGTALGEIRLRVPGAFNIANALAAIAMARKFNIDFQIIKQALEQFSGIWRRFEIVSENPLMINDYAHHPQAVAGTLAAAREFYPSRRIVAIFQPHHRNRTRKLFDEFVSSFDSADVIIINEIYDVAGREDQSDSISSKDLVVAIQKHDTIRKVKRPVLYTAVLAETLETARNNFQQKDCLLIMGAGDIYTITKPLYESIRIS